MGSALLHTGATVQCPHAGQASISVANHRVKVGGQAVAVQSDTTTVSGCPFQIPPASKLQPCVKVNWMMAATRVKVNGTAVLLKSSSALCQSAEQIPQGPPSIVTTQERVKGI